MDPEQRFFRSRGVIAPAIALVKWATQSRSTTMSNDTHDYSIQDLLISKGTGEETATDMIIKARCAKLGGYFSIMEGHIAQDELLAPHQHEAEDQCVVVIEGQLEFEVGGKAGLHFSAGPGDYVLKPKAVMHTFWNKRPQRVRYIELSTSDGFEKYVDSHQGGLVASLKVGEELGMRFDYKRTVELCVEHNLTKLANIDMKQLPKLPAPLQSALKKLIQR